jgi:hypothetical protein
MGVVYAALDTELQRRVAVKLLRGDRDGSLGSEGRERLLREARTLARLSHPNVVTVFDIGLHGAHLFVAMELVEGGSLRAWLARMPRSFEDIVDRMREAGAGLAAAHAAGVVHRDVKPDNILVGDDGRARMTDFGLARSSDPPRATATPLDTRVPDVPLTQTHALVGTPVYMAPEQFEGARVDERSDQWSFCSTLYEAVAGVRPFAAGDLAARASAIAHGRIVEPAAGRRVPGWLRKIVLRGLRANPDERWPSVAALVAALARGRGRKRRLAVAGVAVAMVAGAGVAIAITRDATSTLVIDQHSYMAYEDGRGGGCECPYSTCIDGRCFGECSVKGFRIGSLAPGIGHPTNQDALYGAALDGNTILYATGQRCALDRMMLARRRGPTFQPIDITDRVLARLANARISEGGATLSPDGSSIILRTDHGRRFARLRLAGDEIASVDYSEFAKLHPPLTDAQVVAHPVLSADERTFYYHLHDTQDGEPGPLAGPYSSTRSDRSAPFPPGVAMRGLVRRYNYITGVSGDGLNLFTANDYSTRVLMRASTSDRFEAPAPTVTPPQMYGWRAIPIEGCQRILTTTTPGGCQAEDIIYLEAIR